MSVTSDDFIALEEHVYRLQYDIDDLNSDVGDLDEQIATVTDDMYEQTVRIGALEDLAEKQAAAFLELCNQFKRLADDIATIAVRDAQIAKMEANSGQ